MASDNIIVLVVGTGNSDTDYKAVHRMGAKEFINFTAPAQGCTVKFTCDVYLGLTNHPANTVIPIAAGETYSFKPNLAGSTDLFTYWVGSPDPGVTLALNPNPHTVKVGGVGED